MKHFIMGAALACVFSSLYAQNKIKGKVLDAFNHQPVWGATINVAGKSVASTDKDGFFSIDCGNYTRISVSYIGYESRQQAVKNCEEFLQIDLLPSPKTLSTVEITATSSQEKSLLYQPSSLTKLNDRDLKRGTGLFLDDAINTNVTGVTMERRALSSGQQFNIRGYGNGTSGTRGISSNFDGQGVKVYLNGIPLTDAEGITVLDDIDFGSVGNVEVSKGPSGTLYGLAIAGVVNMKTLKSEKGKTSFGQDVLMGSNGLKRYTTHLATGGEQASLLVNYGSQSYDGFMNHTASHKTFVNVAGDFNLGPKQHLSSYFGYSNSYDERGGELTLQQYQTKDYSGNPAYIKNNAHSQLVSFRAGLSHTYNFSDQITNTTTVFGSGVANNSSSAAGWTDKNPLNYGLRSTFETKFALGDGYGLSGLTGVETQQQRAQTIGYAMVADSNNLSGYNRIGAMRSNQFTLSGTTSVFSEWSLSLPHQLSLIAGIGFSNMKVALNDRFYVATAGRTPSAYAASYGDLFSPHLAINKVLNKALSVYGSYSKGYKAPVSSYFFIPATGQLNTGLKPEVGNQFEIGSKGSILRDRLSYQLAIFETVFRNKMTAVAVPLNNTTTYYSYVTNGGKQRDRGAEFSVKYNAYQASKGFFTTISPFANLSYSDFIYEDYRFQHLVGSQVKTEDYSGQAVAGVAPLTVNAGIDLVSRIGLYANSTYSYRDALPITADGLNSTKSYQLLNARLGYQKILSQHFSLDAFAGVNNLTGTQYYNMIFVNQLPDAYLPAPPKADFFGGVNLNYTF
ncbi:MAG: TonB-dependent receptor [Flavisolibacter sp.]